MGVYPRTEKEGGQKIFSWTSPVAQWQRTHMQCRRHRKHGFNPWIGKAPRGGNGNPLQCSRLKNPMDREAWWATVHRVTESQMQLSTYIQRFSRSVAPNLYGTRDQFHGRQFFQRLRGGGYGNASGGSSYKCRWNFALLWLTSCYAAWFLTGNTQTGISPWPDGDPCSRWSHHLCFFTM